MSLASSEFSRRVPPLDFPFCHPLGILASLNLVVYVISQTFATQLSNFLSFKHVLSSRLASGKQVFFCHGLKHLLVLFERCYHSFSS